VKLSDITDQLRRQALYFSIFQMTVAFCVAVLIWLFWGFSSGVSAFAGGLTCVIPNGFFAWRFFGATGALAAKQIVRGMYRAEMIKLLLTGLLFLVVFTYLPVDVLPYFVGFLLAQFAGWFAPLIIQFRASL
jgi:ATP synthase protein I